MRDINKKKKISLLLISKKKNLNNRGRHIVSVEFMRQPVQTVQAAAQQSSSGVYEYQ